MTGKQSGVATRLRQKYPMLITWHWMNNRPELAVSDAVKEVTAVNHFRCFMDKLYSLYSQSPKSVRALQSVSDELNMQIRKVGRVLGVRWAASSFRTVNTVGMFYKASHMYFETASSDTTVESAAKIKFRSLAKQLASPEFLSNLALMYDTLQEISILSLDLQSHAMTVTREFSLIKISLEKKSMCFASRDSGNNSKYCADFKWKNKENKCQSIRTKYSQQIASKIMHRRQQQRSVTKRSKNIWQKHWKQRGNESNDNRYGELEVRRLCRRFKLDELQAIRGMRELNENQEAATHGTHHNDDLKPLLRTINTQPCSTSECERGFSVMNLIVTRLRTSLKALSIGSLILINLNGPPLSVFNPKKYVRTWLEHHR